MTKDSPLGDLPEYEKPPVAEVSLAVTFEPLDALNAFSIGEMWNSLFKDELSRAEQQPPLLPQVEQFGRAAMQPRVQVQLLAGPPSPRFWFMDESGSNLVQIQRDWFARNWRRTTPEQEYPRFPQIRGPFKRDVERLESFVTDAKLGSLTPVQCEVTYINPIEPEDLGLVSSFFRYWREADSKFLGRPENIHANVRYVMAQDENEYGRLHVSIQPALRTTDDVPIYLLTLTARGAPKGPTIGDVMDFIDTGHEWIVRGFADIATEEMQTRWGRVGAG